MNFCSKKHLITSDALTRNDGLIRFWGWCVIQKSEALKVLCEVYDKCRSCLMLCIDLSQPSSVIVEASDGYQIRVKCDLDYASYCRARKCLAPIISKYKLALEWERDMIVIH